MDAEQVKAGLTAHYDAEAERRESRGLVDFRAGYRERFLELLRSDAIAELVDLGAGTGHEALWFADRGIAVSALDLSPAHVDLIQAKGIEATVGDFYELPYPKGRFRAAWCMSSIMHVPNADLERVLDELVRVLAPGAPLALGLWGGGDTEGIWEQDSAEPKRFYSLRSEKTMRRALLDRFEVIEFDSQSVEGVEGWAYQFWLLRIPG